MKHEDIIICALPQGEIVVWHNHVFLFWNVMTEFCIVWFADCYLRQGDRPLKAHIKANVLRIFIYCSGPYGPTWARPGPIWGRKVPGKTKCFCHTHVYQKSSFLTSIWRFLKVLTCSSDFWPKYASERLWNYLKKEVLEPKRAVFVPPSPCLK